MWGVSGHEHQLFKKGPNDFASSTASGIKVYNIYHLVVGLFAVTEIDKMRISGAQTSSFGYI